MIFLGYLIAYEARKLGLYYYLGKSLSCITYLFEISDELVINYQCFHCRCDVASLLMVSLQGRMEYATE